MGTSLETTPCPCCSSDKFLRLFEKKNREFWRCSQCGLQRQYPLPTSEQLEAYYHNHYAHSGRLAAMLEEQGMVRLRADRRLQEVHSLLLGKKWLDVGCSDGAFVRSAREASVDAQGIELAPQPVEKAIAQGLPVRRGRIEDLSNEQQFDAVTAFDLLEHVPDPAGFVDHAKRLLKPGGQLAVTVPNLSSWSRRLMGRSWYFYIPDGHLHYFTPATLSALLSQRGFEIQHVKAVSKAVTSSYAITQLQMLNPIITAIVKPFVAIIPRSLKNATIPLYLGEVLVVARLPESISDRGK